VSLVEELCSTRRTAITAAAPEQLAIGYVIVDWKADRREV
jgi:hypothetical protein